MAKLLNKDRLKFYLIFIITGILCALFLIPEKTKDIDLISILTSANYIPLILNNIYIFYIYTKTKKVKSIYDKIVTRIGTKKLFYKYILNSIIDIIFYFIITYLIIYLKLGINLHYINFLYLFIFLNFSNFLVQELISMSIFIVEKGNKYIIIPIIMNLLFHYYLIPFLVLKYIGY